MKRVKWICLFAVLAALCLLSFGFASAGESVYTFSEPVYDIESGELSYLKVEYSQNTYTTTNITSVDATGAPVDVSDDAQYVFLEAEYNGAYTDDTVVSIKYKNNGVTSIPMHMEYAAGISADGVDYERGFRYICVDALSESTWNASFSKSIDGYDVVTVLFGNYASAIHDATLLGFRLYLDYAKTVSSARSIEIYGVTVHDKSEVPSFASDPKGCRFSKFTDESGERAASTLTFEGRKELSAYILDYDPAYTSIRLELSFKGEGSLNVLLDGEIAYSTVMQNGKQSGEIDLVKANYEGIKLVFEGAGTVTYAVTFITKPYADAFSGSGFTITKTAEGETVFTYTYTVGWYSVVAPIRKYDSSYDSLRLSMLLAQPTVIGIMIDGVYLWSHYDHSEPVEGVMEFFFDLTSFNITDNSVIEIWIDPAITGYTGTEGTKTVTITELSFINTDKMPKASIVIAESFTFDYDGKGKAASGATTNSGETLVYEYKRASDADKAYSTDLPVDAGEYDVRVTSPLNNTYGVTYAYAKLFINKITPDMPKVSEITVDYANEAVIYDASVLAVSRFEDFSYILPSGGSVAYGMTLYFKYIDSVNYSESAVNSVTLSQREGEVSFSINYALEITAQNVTDQQEYSTDGLNWTTGQNKKVKVVPGNIYLFRVKATDHSFAGEICYVAASYRPTLQNVQIALQATDKTSITVNPIAGAEYKLSDTIWQTDTYFGYLKAGDTVTVTVRLKATDSSFASDEISAEFTVGGEKEPEEKPGDEKPADKGCGSAAVPVGMMLLCGIFVACQQRRRV